MTDKTEIADVTLDGWDSDALEMIQAAADAEEPEDLDPDSERHHDDGWLRIYVECPECHVPMSKITTDATDVETPEYVVDATESTYSFVCPECHRMATKLHVQKVTADTNELESAVAEVREFIASIFDAFR